MALMRQVGFLVAATPDNWAKYIQFFKAKLRTANVNITFLPPAGADGDPDLLADAANYLANNVEVIVTASTQGALACKAATALQIKKTPFVFASVGEPALSGLTPIQGSNFTGCSNMQLKLATKRADFMKQKGFPAPVAVVGNQTIEPMKSAMTAAFNELQSQGMQPQYAPIVPGTNVDAFINTLKISQGIKSLYVCSDMYLTSKSTRLNQKAHAAGMMTMWEFSEHVTDHGGDGSLGVNFKDLFEKAADYVDQILAGTDPSTLPIFEPTAAQRVEMVRKKRGTARPKKKK